MPTIRLIVKTVFYCTLGLIAFAVISVAFNFGLLGVATLFGIDPSYMKYSSLVLLWLFIIVPKRFLRIKRPQKITAKAIIKSPIDVVWDAINPKPDAMPFKKMYSEIRAVPDYPDRFEFIFADTLAADGTAKNPMFVDRIRSEPPHELALFHANQEDQGNFGVGASTEYYHLTETDEGTHIEIREITEYTSFWLLLTLAIVNPARDTLKSLKHHCEGTTDTSWAARQMKEINDSNGMAASKDLTVIGVTACIYLTAILGGLVFAAISMSA